VGEAIISELPGTLLATKYLAWSERRRLRVAVRDQDGRRYLDVRVLVSVPAVNGTSERWVPTHKGISCPVDRADDLLRVLQEVLAADTASRPPEVVRASGTQRREQSVDAARPLDRPEPAPVPYRGERPDLTRLATRFPTTPAGVRPQSVPRGWYWQRNPD
jgi:hypothetical protein